jgi:hypothetical protein
MKKLSFLVLATVLTTSAYADVFKNSDDNLRDRLLSNQARVAALGVQLDSMGVNVDTNVAFNSVSNTTQKIKLVHAKYHELRSDYSANK